MFKAVLESSFPVEQSIPTTQEPSLENNALRYLAGFIPLSQYVGLRMYMPGQNIKILKSKKNIQKLKGVRS